MQPVQLSETCETCINGIRSLLDIEHGKLDAAKNTVCLHEQTDMISDINPYAPMKKAVETINNCAIAEWHPCPMAGRLIAYFAKRSK